jgi:hypothetical protein
VFHAASFLKLDFDGKSKFFREKMEALRSRIPVWRSMLLAKFKHDSGNATSSSMALGKIWQTNDRACWTYVPKPYPGKITDFRPVKQYRVFSKPAGMLVEPFVEHLAVALKTHMDAAIPGSETRC